MTLDKPYRVRSKAHLTYIRTLGCCVPRCRRSPTQAHHLTRVPSQPKAGGVKTGDQWAVPLCFMHHDPRSSHSVHFRGDEDAWWSDHHVDPLAIAARLWLGSRARLDA